MASVHLERVGRDRKSLRGEIEKVSRNSARKAARQPNPQPRARNRTIISPTCLPRHRASGVVDRRHLPSRSGFHGAHDVNGTMRACDRLSWLGTPERAGDRSIVGGCGAAAVRLDVTEGAARRYRGPLSTLSRVALDVIDDHCRRYRRSLSTLSTRCGDWRVARSAGVGERAPRPDDPPICGSRNNERPAAPKGSMPWPSTPYGAGTACGCSSSARVNTPSRTATTVTPLRGTWSAGVSVMAPVTAGSKTILQHVALVD